ncbi:two-component regulatory protein [Janibacter sp. HTCC2649]|uniref:response regulator transcription factor n=1 Tax=Janibacter sp. HTCC2649 TaxID=313589 RepID=UPI000066ED52|nr:response regulator transcription factor [Janibacter sp. HTCC2649]EAP99229.1 two-component regulatory protein [Janibacter sp. HTCC2649]
MTEAPWRALVVEDEPAMRDIITFALETQDFTTLTAGSAEEAWTIINEQQVDLVVLDVMLPGMSGIELCRRVTSTKPVPVILLTALGETSQRIAGLEAGASDYVTKPFHPRELALRAAGLVRRSPLSRGALTQAGPVTLDLRSATAYVTSKRVDLTSHEYRLLAALVTHPDEDLPFRQLLLLGWGDAQPLGGRELLKTAVYRLRLKLESIDPVAKGCIQSVRGVGYRYVQPPVETDDSVTGT